MSNTSPRHSTLLPRLLAVVVALGLVALLQVYAGRAFQGVERFTSDLGWKLVASGSDRAERRVVVVDIDETSLQKVGPWPWPRATLESLSRKLADAGVAVQVYDIVVPESKEGDERLAAAWGASPVVAGQILSLDANVNPKVGSLEGALGMAACPPFAPSSHGHIANTETLARSGAAVGHMTPRFEDDGVIRRVPALICHQGRAYPSLTLAALWLLAQPNTPGQALSAPDWYASSGSGLLNLLSPTHELTSKSLPGLVVGLEANGDMRVPYRTARQQFASVSAADVLVGRADAKLLAGAVALVGATAFGLSDVVATPLSSVASGAEVHAHALVGLLDNRIPYSPVGADALQWLVGLGFLVLLLTMTGRSSSPAIKRLPAAGLVFGVLAAVASVAFQAGADLILPWAVPALLAVVGAVLLAAVEHALTLAQRERLSAHLGAYLPQPVARRLMGMDPSGSVQVEQRQVSVLAADIRNFSAYAAHRAPAETTALLHAYCCIAVDVVEQHGGVVENVVGDSIIAVWNAYSECLNHAQQSLLAAQELVRATRVLLEPQHPVRDTDVVQPLALGIGLESGQALVGSFGPQRRRAHAALGEPVSVAVRLQKMTQELSFPILVGPQLAAAVAAQDTAPLGEYLLEGLAKHYTLHVPAGWARLLTPEIGWQQMQPVGHGAEGDTWSSGSPALRPSHSL